MSEKQIVGIVFATVMVLLIIWAIYHTVKQKKQNRETQRIITDRDLLRKIAAEPDGFLTPHRLAETTGLNLAEARSRLTSLAYGSILTGGYNSSMRSFYSLRKPLTEREPPELSTEPFLTVADIIAIFRHHDFKPDNQDMIMTTGLPLNLIKREMKYFTKENVVDSVTTTNAEGTQSTSIYILKEPYRSNPEQFLDRAGELDLELREILRNDKFFV